MTRRAIIGAEIFDGWSLQAGRALLLDGATCAGLVPSDAIPDGFSVEKLDGGTLCPGFVDLQVNGGGGVLFNTETTVEGLAAIADAHWTTGTRAFLPTLITDTPGRTRDAVDAVEAAIRLGVPGVLGIHLEGPHLSVARKGAHDPDLIRPMVESDETFLIEAAQRLPNVMVTVAPESVRRDQIARLVDAEVLVSLGHSNCTVDEAWACFEAGARCVTHLFNAMSQITGRAPGLVGAALSYPHVSAGLIADGIHVHPANMRLSVSAKQDPGHIFLVTDAMATVGSDITEFELNGRRVLRQDGRLTLEDGTLAGADLEMSQALSVMIQSVGLPKETVFAMATRWPADLLRDPKGAGRFQEGSPAQAILLDHKQAVLRSM